MKIMVCNCGNLLEIYDDITVCDKCNEIIYNFNKKEEPIKN